MTIVHQSCLVLWVMSCTCPNTVIHTYFWKCGSTIKPYGSVRYKFNMIFMVISTQPLMSGSLSVKCNSQNALWFSWGYSLAQYLGIANGYTCTKLQTKPTAFLQTFCCVRASNVQHIPMIGDPCYKVQLISTFTHTARLFVFCYRSILLTYFSESRQFS